MECLHHAEDYGGLLLLATSAGDADTLARVGQQAAAGGYNNISFISNFLLGRLEECLEILVSSKRLPEAAFFARTYLPSQMSRVVGLWKEKLSATNQKAAQSLADPAEYENLFPGLHESIQAEEALRSERSQLQPANAFPHITVRTGMA
jgi:coatomer subunit beta'